MHQTELKLSNKDCTALDECRIKGLRLAREVNREHILAALDEKVPRAVICQVLGIGRTAIWRTRAEYQEGGLDLASRDVWRPGAPRKYETDVGAEVAALDCSEPPKRAKRLTRVLLERKARGRPGMQDISREAMGRSLKKTASSPGGN
jgi:hypothetical protein